ncbi:hypothetical protein TNCV_4247251 [Trichonephila clavipes]|nr:hypothetical protein TNCV_4247251 [Trichonephila clavipes]
MTDLACTKAQSHDTPVTSPRYCQLPCGSRPVKKRTERLPDISGNQRRSHEDSRPHPTERLTGKRRRYRTLVDGNQKRIMLKKHFEENLLKQQLERSKLKVALFRFSRKLYDS